MRHPLSWRRRLAAVTIAALAVPAAASAHDGSHADRAEHTLGTAFQFNYDALDDPLDPPGTPLPCELLPAPGAAGTYQVNISHIAYRCGIAGTDVEFQSRTDSAGRMHDFAFAGSIGAGFRIWDVTTADYPVLAGGTNITGYQNDVVIRGDYAMQAYDAVSGNAANASPCLGQGKVGVDIFKLNYNRATAKFDPQLITCVETPGGSHTATIHPEGRWLISSNAGRYAIDFIDLIGLTTGQFNFTNRPKLRYRLIDVTRRTATNCPATGVTWKCFTAKNPAGQDAVGSRNGSIVQGDCYPYDKIARPCFRPHDVFFSADGDKMFCACLNSTFMSDISRLDGSISTLANPFPTFAIINNRGEPLSSNTDSSKNIQLSHQADTTPDGRILVISDERGGGTSETSCNEPGGDIVGALTFYAIAPVSGIARTSAATLRNPIRLGEWVYPSPTPEDLGRKERGCTVHVFRIGGNGAGYPGTGLANAGLGGVSSLSNRQLVTAHYGAGVWYVDFSAKPDSKKLTESISEDDDTSWGNTLGGLVQPTADLWSAKEYKGHIYAGDLTRGFDVYRMTKRAY